MTITLLSIILCRFFRYFSYIYIYIYILLPLRQARGAPPSGIPRRERGAARPGQAVLALAQAAGPRFKRPGGQAPLRAILGDGDGWSL